MRNEIMVRIYSIGVRPDVRVNCLNLPLMEYWRHTTSSCRISYNTPCGLRIDAPNHIRRFTDAQVRMIR
jgi:hypothetical protein